MGSSVLLAVKIGRGGGGREPGGGGRGGRRDQGEVFGRSGDGDGPREGRRRGGSQRRGRRTGLEDVGDVQLGGWNDKSCLKHVRDGGSEFTEAIYWYSYRTARPSTEHCRL